MLHQLGLFIHVIGIFMIAGGNVGNFIVERQFWNNVVKTPETAKKIAPLLLLFPPVIILGALLMLLSGLVMLYSVNWGFVGQTWFTIKMVIFVLLILNGRIVGNPTLKKIESNIQTGDYAQVSGVLKLKIKRFHAVQYSLLLVLIIVTLFRF